MKKNFYYLSLLAGMVFGMTCFTSCSNDDNAVPTQQEIATKIIGKWIQADINGKPAPTNEKMVTSIVSATKAYQSFSRSDYYEEGKRWGNNREFDVKIEGNKMTLTSNGRSTTLIREYVINSISGNEFSCSYKNTIIRNGEVVDSNETPDVRFVRITEDFSKDILGTWEGRVSSEEGSEYDDGKLHRWDYKADGTFVFYFQDENDEWQVSNDEFAEYFCDGTLLCTRWKNVGEGTKENREWWEVISIENGVMKWYGLRQREDGTTYTASFYMTKVK